MNNTWHITLLLFISQKLSQNEDKYTKKIISRLYDSLACGTTSTTSNLK